MKSNSNLPKNKKKILTNSLAQQCESSKSGFSVIPFEDRRLVRKHGGLGLQDYWLDCWEADPFGSRYVLMPDADLKSRNQRKYRKQLKDLGLFMFEVRKDGTNYQLWVLNRHGSRVKSYWEGINGTNSRGTQNTERGTQNTERGAQNAERGTQNAELKLKTLTQRGVQSRSISFQYLKDSISSSISPDGGSGEEDIENSKKTEEATQDDAIRPEGTSKPELVVEPEDTSKPETVVEPESISEPQPPASFVDQPETVAKPKDSDRDECSGAASANENQSQATEDAALLKWLVEVKLPSMELNEAPRNPEAYAKAMIRRDGDALREEFGEVVRSSQFREECATLTERVEARVGEWRQAGIQLSVLYDFDGRPQVLLDGATIAGVAFLNMAIESKSVVLPISTFINPDHAQNRKARQGRLKTASTIGECPSFEFLVECWGDVLLQPQIKQAIKKHPHWGVFVDDNGALVQFPLE